MLHGFSSVVSYLHLHVKYDQCVGQNRGKEGQESRKEMAWIRSES